MAELDVKAIMAEKPEGVDEAEWRALKGIDVAPEAAPETTVVQAVVVHQAMGGSYYSLSTLVDAAGTSYLCVANELLENSNITWAELYITPAGQGITQAPQYRVNPVNKIDRVGIFNSGADLIIWLITHALGGIPGQPRPIAIEAYRAAGIFATTPDYVAQRGGEGVTLVPVTPEDIDYARIQQMIEQIVGATPNDSLVSKLTAAGRQTVRQAVREIDKEALVYEFDPANYNDAHDPEHLAKKFQDEFYSYVANLMWGQLFKFGNEVGYKPPRQGVAAVKDKVVSFFKK